MKDYARSKSGGYRANTPQSPNASNNESNANNMRPQFSQMQTKASKPKLKPRPTSTAAPNRSYQNNQTHFSSKWLLVISLTTLILLFLLAKSMSMMSSIEHTNKIAKHISTQQIKHPFEPQFDFYETLPNKNQNNTLANSPQESFSTGTYHSI